MTEAIISTGNKSEHVFQLLLHS